MLVFSLGPSSHNNDLFSRPSNRLFRFSSLVALGFWKLSMKYMKQVIRVLLLLLILAKRMVTNVENVSQECNNVLHVLYLFQRGWCVGCWQWFMSLVKPGRQQRTGQTYRQLNLSHCLAIRVSQYLQRARQTYRQLHPSHCLAIRVSQHQAAEQEWEPSRGACNCSFSLTGDQSLCC